MMLVNSEQFLSLHSFFFARTQYFKVNTPSDLISSWGSLVWMSQPKSFSPLSPNFVPGLKNFNSRSFLCAFRSLPASCGHIFMIDVLCYNIATTTLKKSSIKLILLLRIISRLQLLISSALYSVLILFSPSASSRLIWASWSRLLPELGQRLFLDHKLVSVTKTYIQSFLVEKREIVLALMKNHKYIPQ